MNTLNTSSQEKPIKGYKIDGDYIIFTFNKKDYLEATNERNNQKLDFDDFDIEKVVVAGSFNLWSRDNWEMVKVNNNIYQLKKRIDDFNDDFNWEFKFVINNSIWAEPSKEMANIVPAIKDGYRINKYNFKILPVNIKKDGNAKFFLKGYTNAKEVILSGSFNYWNEHLYKMKKTKNGWKLNLQLKPNDYQYRFIVDGNWIEDPDNSNRIPNEFGEYNSVIDIRKKITFFLSDFKNAKKVILAGTFNNWSEDQLKMKKTENGWIYKITLSGGKHHYKFIVDGHWKLDPNNPIKEYDGNGNINSVKMVK
ncbi:hypothetical protein BW723_17190 [Polaribacter reichenbachii]|uniref:AMP-activated protein kinase glycogen-binding domain-containing protein n=2 Tax=Polaribacter reichenbachii TaxID=996801 RepID=A0A1B8U427_9FLAO|nr:hypothetical protein BW723_17190 [Polaribacter reichenbachii]AUC18556.1 hypothetical protein BTO17_07585 [Polaribacter reichenbachii]OBY66626.1 hypothetical protein LPB301_06410 [Polaribacter reichenbachii]